MYSSNSGLFSKYIFLLSVEAKQSSDLETESRSKLDRPGNPPLESLMGSNGEEIKSLSFLRVEDLGSELVFEE